MIELSDIAATLERIEQRLGIRLDAMVADLRLEASGRFDALDARLDRLEGLSKRSS